MTYTHDYSTLFYYSPLPMWVYEIDTFKILDVNQAAMGHYGYSREEFLAMSIKDLRPEEEIPQMIAANKSVAKKEGNIYLGTFTHLKKNGDRIRLDINGHKVVFGGKNCMMVVCQDITVREQQLLELQQSDRRLRTASEIARLGYWKFDILANTLTWSDKVYDIWERDPETFEVGFDSFFNSIHPDDRDHFLRAQDAALAGESELDFDHRILLPDGHVKWVREMGRLNKDAEGNPLSFEGTVQDITEKKEEEQHLKLLESVVTHTHDSVVITEAEPQDEGGPRILYVNEAFTQMTGYTPEEVIGKSPRFLHGSKSDKKELKRLEESLRKWEPCEITAINYKKNGEPYWVNFSVSPVANEKGSYTHWIAIQRDVTASKNEQLQKDLLAQISKSFSDKQSLGNSLQHICECIAAYGNFSFCEVWLPVVHNSTLRLTATHAHHPAAETFYQQSSSTREMAFGEGLPGTVWNEKQSVLWGNIDQSDLFVRKEAAQQSGVKSVLGIPLLYVDTIVGVLVVGTAENEAQLKPYYPVLSKLESYIGSEINRKRLEENLDYLFEALPDIICMLDFDGRFVKINKAGCELLGYSEPEIVGTPYQNFIHPDDLNSANIIEEKLNKGQHSIELENRYITKEGMIVWLGWHFNVALEEGLVYASAKNITEQKKLGEILDDASHLAKIGGWEIDLINEQLFWSEGIHHIYESDPDTFRPTLDQAIEFYRDDYKEKIKTVIKDAIAKGEPFEYEAVFISNKGHEKWVKAMGQPEFINGKCVRIYGSFQDITDYKKISYLYEETSELAKIGSWELDLSSKSDRDSMYWSPIVRKIIEVDADYDASLTGGMEFYSETSKPKVEKAIKRLIDKGIEYDEEVLLTTRTGQKKWVRIIGKSERVNGVCTKIFGSIQDIHTMKTNQLQLKEILDSISDAFYAVDAQWNFTYFNKEAERMLGKKSQAVLGKSIWEEFAPALGTHLETVYRRVAAEGKSESFEYHYPGNGSWYELNAYPSNGGVSAYFKNIDERRKAAEQLQKAYKEKNQILESIGDAFFAVDKDWVVTYWNKEAEHVLGRKRDAVLGKNLWQEFADAVALDFYKEYHKAMDTGKTVSFEEYYPALSKWFEVTAYPSADGLSVYFKDVTLRKETDIKILQANERFEKVTQATTDAIWDWDLDQDDLYSGNGFEKLFGNQLPQHHKGTNFWKEHIHLKDREEVQRSLQAHLYDREKEKWRAEYHIIHNNANEKTVINKGVIIRNQQGKAIRMVGAITDISERKRHERELYELNKALKKNVRELETSNEQLEQFAFIASHDLQEPLRMIASFLNLLQRKYGEQLDEKAHQYIFYATDGAARMKQIILDLLDYSRAGKLTEEQEPVNINEILEEYRALRRKLIQEKDVSFLMDDFPEMKGYKAPLTQTLHCLLDNAIKYSKETVSPVIKVSAETFDTHWQINIADNGIGIDPVFFDKIFIIFQRLHNRGSHSGTGIGLSICKKNVESWGGKIWVASVPGEGSTFSFTINNGLLGQ